MSKFSAEPVSFVPLIVSSKSVGVAMLKGSFQVSVTAGWFWSVRGINWSSTTAGAKPARDGESREIEIAGV